MSLAEWMPLLGWDKLPNFGSIHELDANDFLDYYFDEDPEIRRMTSNLLVGLRGEKPATINTRLIGNPGVGKTTYMYYIRALTKKEKSKDFSRYYYWIFHSDKAVYNGKINRSVILRDVERCFLRWYTNSDIEYNLYNKITEEKMDADERIQKLTDLYIHNSTVKTKMKTLIYVIDGVDTVDEQLVIPLVKEIMTLLVPISIRVILTVREIEYKKFKAPTTRLIDTFFPMLKKFPAINLKQIVDKRLSKYPNTINPFSEELCSFAMDVFNNDHRLGLARLLQILEDNSPGNLENTNEGICTKNDSETSIVRFL